jgi:hydrogenase expression/formation protein HypE
MSTDFYISLAHGNGGRLTRSLIADIFAKHLCNAHLDIQAEAAILNWDATHVVMTTDGFTVQPLEFPHSNIGALAVHGTCNDLAVMGARPIYLSLNVFIEEGLSWAQLDRIIASLAFTAAQINVAVVTGDTKVLPRGQGGGLYLATTGIGRLETKHKLNMHQIQPGDAILVSGSVGDHGIAVMLAREAFGLKGNLASDTAHVLPLTRALLGLEGLRFMRDPTRGGLATVCHEIIQATGYTISLQQGQIPIAAQVQVVCDMLGYDPLYLACEGRVVAVVAAEQAQLALSIWRELGYAQANIIGQVQQSKQDLAKLVLHTELGGERVLQELVQEPLPRIC